MRFDAVDERWLEAFKVHLLENLAQNTARLYLAKVKAALNQAVRQKIIPIKSIQLHRAHQAHRE